MGHIIASIIKEKRFLIQKADFGCYWGSTIRFSLYQVKKMKALVLKFDLMEACDMVDWNIIRSILLQIDLPLEVTNWIIAFVSSTNFVVLINGTPRGFFNA